MALIMDTISLSIIHALIDLECLAKFLKRTSTDISSERCRLRSNNDNNNNNNHYYYYNIYVYSAISTQGVGGGVLSYVTYSPIRVCAAQRGRDFETPDLERGIHFRGVF